MQWDKKETKYINYDVMYLGNYVIMTIFNDGSRSKTEPKKFKLTCALPGFKPVLGYFVDVVTGRQYAEKAFAQWLTNTGLQEKLNEGV